MPCGSWLGLSQGPGQLCWWGGTLQGHEHLEMSACGAARGPHWCEGVEGRAEKVYILKYGMVSGGVCPCSLQFLLISGDRLSWG